MEIISLIALTAIYSLIFLILSIIAYRIHKLKIEELKKAPAKTIEAQQILHDLTRQGVSIIKIIPLSPDDLFWRSPK